MQPISFGAPPPKKATAGENAANGSAEPLMGGNSYEMGNLRADENV